MVLPRKDSSLPFLALTHNEFVEFCAAHHVDKVPLTLPGHVLLRHLPPQRSPTGALRDTLQMYETLLAFGFLYTARTTKEVRAHNVA